MQRKRRKTNYKEFPDSSGNSHNLHSIPTLGMSEKSGAGVEPSNRNAREDIYQPTSVVWWRSPHCRSSERRNRTRASHIIMTPLSRLARYPRSLIHNTGISRYLRPLPYVSIVSLLVLSFLAFVPNLYGNDSAYAVEDVGSNSSAIARSAGESSRATSAGLSVSSTKLTETVSPGSTVYVNNTVSVNVKDIESYSLTISGPTTMKNGNTTISGSGGNTPSSMGDNTWGYAWDSSNNGSGFTDSSATYNSLPGINTSQKLTAPALSNYGVEFSRKLGFAAKFAEDADPGHYIADITLSLVATPRTLGVWSTGQAAGISTMQQMNTAICNQVPTPAAGATDVPTMTLLDSRDGNYYNIAKYADGRCWMQENLRIYNTTISAADSDFSGSDITLPSSTKADFANNDTSKYSYQSYLSTASEASAGVSGYYNWYTATAGAGNSSVATQNQNVNTSICPKGWTLPTGGSAGNPNTENTWSNFYKLFRNMGLTISNSSLSHSHGGYASWGTGDLATVQGDIYNFKYTGRVFGGSLVGGTDYGYWWSSAANSATSAYSLDISSSTVDPGTDYNGRYNGFAVRCIAREPDLSGITTMQEMTPGVCEKTPLISGQKYSEAYQLKDTRDGNTYTVRKFADGRCWMTDNLRIYNKTIKAAESDFTTDTVPSGEITLPNSSKNDFTNGAIDRYTYKSYLSTASEADAGVSGYYNWYTATAGAGSSSETTGGKSLNTSICPKGWTLPTGGRAGDINTESTWSDYYKLFRNMNLTISTNSLSITSSTNWGTGDLVIVQGDVYNFKYGGLVYAGSLSGGTNYGDWWSSTISDANNAYVLFIDNNYVIPGNYGNGGRNGGHAVRCINRE